MNGGINPSDLSLQSSSMQPGFYGNSGYANYNNGSSTINDEELAEDDSLGYDANGFPDDTLQDFNGPMYGVQGQGFNQVGLNNMYSNTPDGNPLASPYMNNFEQFHGMPMQHNIGSPRFPQANARDGSVEMRSGSFEDSYRGMARPGSGMNSKAPMTPKSAAHAISSGHRHGKSLSQPWDGPAGSFESPLSSPGHSLGHPGILDMMSAKHASLPARTDMTVNQQEAKRRRRRESHNMVERRRRDNINDRIADLSRLVPQHRLEDEKVRKALQTNPLPSPNSDANATSLLAGGTGRRATGHITTGIPLDDKDKGPNKGDILNGAVAWTRDLMWCLYEKFSQEDEMRQVIANLGGHYPYEVSEDELRMRTELINAIDTNDKDNFAYSRGDGSGLRVPGHTDPAGNPDKNSSIDRSHYAHGRSQPRAGRSPINGGVQPYSYPNGHDVAFKEEDEYGMDTT